MPNQGVILEKGTYPTDSFFIKVKIVGISFDIRFNLSPPGFKLTEILPVILLQGLELNGIDLPYGFINKGN